MGKGVQFDRSLLEVEHPGGRFSITAEEIRHYCHATGETNPIHLREEVARAHGFANIVAPVALCAVLGQKDRRSPIGLEGVGRIVHAGQTVEPLVPVVAGDTVETRSKLVDVYQKRGRTGKMAFLVWETVFYNQAEKAVLKVRDSWAVRQKA